MRRTFLETMEGVFGRAEYSLSSIRGLALQSFIFIRQRFKQRQTDGLAIHK
jgi:hypothetical protein